MSAHAERQLLEFLERGRHADPARPRPAGFLPAEGADAGRQMIDGRMVAHLRAQLIADPSGMLAHAPAVLGDAPSVADGMRLLNDAEAALRTPNSTLAALAANRSDESYELPEKYRFPGYDSKAVPIRPSEKRFESTADAPAWAATAAAAWFFRLATPKPDLPIPAGAVEYPLREENGQTTVALFSDWGTGYYHSNYIARHVVHLQAAQAVHLGDVYYTGTAGQFDEQFTPLLDRVMRAMPLYAMNANHEMDSHGIPYLNFLATKAALGPATGHVAQPQETSYFALVNDRYQVVGIDTAFYGNGRYENGDLRAWLRERLEAGREAGRTTVMLSQNEPYGPSRGDSVAARQLHDLYTKDLGDWVKEGLVHAWFWGDEHYAAIYEPNDDVPFVGSCIGHGGYPYGRMHNDTRSGDVTRVVWTETEARFPEDTGLRQDRGNNGFCMLTLRPDGIRVEYWDWLLRLRHAAELQRKGGRLRIR